MTILLRVEYQPQRLSACLRCSLCSTSRASGGVVGAGEGRTAARLVSSVAIQRKSEHRNDQRCCKFDDIDASEDTRGRGFIACDGGRDWVVFNSPARYDDGGFLYVFIRRRINNQIGGGPRANGD